MEKNAVKISKRSKVKNFVIFLKEIELYESFKQKVEDDNKITVDFYSYLMQEHYKYYVVLAFDWHKYNWELWNKVDFWWQKRIPFIYKKIEKFTKKS